MQSTTTAGQQRQEALKEQKDAAYKQQHPKAYDPNAKQADPLEKAHQEKVDRERDIMRDPHENEKDFSTATSATKGRPMPRYTEAGRPGNSVSALRIKDIKPVPAKPIDAELHFVEPGFGPVRVSAPWITANNPRIGGWFVADATGTRFANHPDFADKYLKGATT